MRFFLAFKLGLVGRRGFGSIVTVRINSAKRDRAASLFFN
jgi:hypothetical protein